MGTATIKAQGNTPLNPGKQVLSPACTFYKDNTMLDDGILVLVTLGIYCSIAGVVAYVSRWFHRPSDEESIELVFGAFWPLMLVAGIVLTLKWILENFSTGLDSVVGYITKKRLDKTEQGELWRYPRPREALVQLVVEDNSGEHRIRVPPTMKTVQEALTWSYNLKTEYNPVKRT